MASRGRFKVGNPFCHVELGVDDVAKAKKFYKALFDWSFVDMKAGPDEDYVGVVVGQGVGGGIATKQGGAASQWLPYVAVADVKKSIAKAKKAGATIVVEHREIPGMGALAIFVDPFGATVGLWQPHEADRAPKADAKKEKKKKDKSDGAAKAAKKAEKKRAKEAERAKRAAKKAKKERAKKAEPEARATASTEKRAKKKAPERPRKKAAEKTTAAEG